MNPVPAIVVSDTGDPSGPSRLSFQHSLSAHAVGREIIVEQPENGQLGVRREPGDEGLTLLDTYMHRNHLRGVPILYTPADRASYQGLASAMQINVGGFGSAIGVVVSDERSIEEFFYRGFDASTQTLFRTFGIWPLTLRPWLRTIVGKNAKWHFDIGTDFRSIVPALDGLEKGERLLCRLPRTPATSIARIALRQQMTEVVGGLKKRELASIPLMLGDSTACDIYLEAITDLEATADRA